MSDIDQASTVASTIPNAATKSAAPVVDGAMLMRRFDGRMHARMESAKTDAQWDEVFAILISAHNNKNLRANVRDRFLKECPHQAKTDALRTATGFKMAQVVDIDALNQRFDDNLMARMDDAHSRKFWAGIVETMVRAKENKNLRPPVREYFIESCPFPDLVEEFRKATACAVAVVKKKSKKKK